MAASRTNCVRERGQVTRSTCWLIPATGNSGNGGFHGGGLGAGGGGEGGRDDERSCGKVEDTLCFSPRPRKSIRWFSLRWKRVKVYTSKTCHVLRVNYLSKKKVEKC